MNTKYIFPLALGAAVCLTACKTTLAPEMYNNPMPVQTTAQMRTDAKILGSLIVLNKNEIAAGNEALIRASHPSVKSYGNMMIREHGANLRATENLSRKMGILPEMGPTALTLQKKGHQELSKLKHIKGAAFDRAYIHAMVKGHMEALHLIDRDLSQTSDMRLRRHLEATRMHVMMHLERAQGIQRQMGY